MSEQNTQEENERLSQKATEKFFSTFTERMHLSQKQQERDQRILSVKSEMLIPIRMMLKKLIDARTHVENSGLHDLGIKNRSFAPQLLEAWESESSPKWQPGGSIFLDHPAHLEIAVTNAKGKEEPRIHISCVDAHPHSHMFQESFQSSEEACEALAKFLSLNTVKIENPDVLMGGYMADKGNSKNSSRDLGFSEQPQDD